MSTVVVTRTGDHEWSLLHQQGRWGRYATRAQALAAARRLQAFALATNGHLDILDQQPWGEVVSIRDPDPQRPA